MKQNFYTDLITCVFILSIAACKSFPKRPLQISQGDYTYAKKAISYIIEEEIDKNKLQDVRISFTNDTKILYASDGKREISKEIGQDKAKFRIGSITKLFTAIAIMKLYEEKKIDLDSPLRKYLSNFKMLSAKAQTDKVTIRTLLNHHAGVPAIEKDFFLTDKTPAEDILTVLQKERLNFTPGERFQYCNTCYTLLGKVIEEQSKKPYGQYIQNTILQPLGMNDTGIFDPQKTQNLLAGYEIGLFGFREVKAAPIRDKPAGDLVSTLADMSKFGMFFCKGGKDSTILKPETLQSMYKIYHRSSPLSNYRKYGLGFMVNFLNIPHSKLNVGHAGDLPGHTAALYFLPEEKLAAVILTNTGTGRMARFKLANEGLAYFLEGQNGKKHSPAHFPEDNKTIQVKQDLQKLTGGYNSDMGIAFFLSGKKDHLNLQAHNLNGSLYPKSETSYQIKAKILGLFSIDIAPLLFGADRVRFHFLPEKPGYAYMQMQYGNFTFYSLFEKSKPVPKDIDIQSILGTYRLTAESIKHINQEQLPLYYLKIYQDKQGYLIGEKFLVKGDDSIGKVYFSVFDKQAKVLSFMPLGKVNVEADRLRVSGLEFFKVTEQ
ncbi:MAG: serine hydrolase domain-containing protein [Spirochaetota bacterium]